jgi:hypothetical protein
MTDRLGLTQEEQAAIAAHAQRMSAYVQLKRLVASWTAELELQEKANRAVARAIGTLVVLATFATWVYLLWRLGQLLLLPAPSPMHMARLVFWYPAAMAALFPLFFLGFSYAIYKVLPRLQRMCVYAFPTAIALFVVGLVVAPLAVWLVAS